MRHARGVASLFATFSLALVLGSCADHSPTQPDVSAPEPAAGLLGSLLKPVLGPVEVLERTKVLEEQVVSAVVGYNGGVLTLEDAGLEVVIPRGALRRDTRITITSPAGDLVGYHFEPHGLKFRKKVRLNQNLNNTEASPSLLGWLLGTDLQGAYFEGELLPVVDALELLDLNLLGSDHVAVLEISHFSGYVIATN